MAVLPLSLLSCSFFSSTDPYQNVAAFQIPSIQMVLKERSSETQPEKKLDNGQRGKCERERRVEERDKLGGCEMRE